MKIAIINTQSISLIDVIKGNVIAEVETCEPKESFKLCASDILEPPEAYISKPNKWIKERTKNNYKHKLKKNKKR